MPLSKKAIIFGLISIILVLCIALFFVWKDKKGSIEESISTTGEILETTGISDKAGLLSGEIISTGGFESTGSNSTSTAELTNMNFENNDKIRRTDAETIANAIIAYTIDYAILPTNIGGIDEIKDELKAAGLQNIPTDPDKSRSFNGIANMKIQSGQYGYIDIKEKGINGFSFIIMTATDTTGFSNWVAGVTELSKDTNIEDIVFCKTIIEGVSNSNNNHGTCTYKKGDESLRYILVVDRNFNLINK